MLALNEKSQANFDMLVDGFIEKYDFFFSSNLLVTLSLIISIAVSCGLCVTEIFHMAIRHKHVF